MDKFWITLLVPILALCSMAVAAKPPVKAPAAPTPEIYSVKVNYNTLEILIDGTNLDPASVSVTLAGVSAILSGSSTDNQLILSPSTDVAAAVNSLGNYLLSLTNDGGSVSLSVFFPFALVYLPPGDGPCPCAADWDLFAGQLPPDGYSGLEPYCMVDSAGNDYITVQFWDAPNNNYWVLTTEWSTDTSSGSCAQYLDGPTRPLDTVEQYDACAAYLRSQYIEVYPPTGNTCLF